MRKLKRKLLAVAAAALMLVNVLSFSAVSSANPVKVEQVSHATCDCSGGSGYDDYWWEYWNKRGKG
jgi:hypothetical protein